MLSFCLIVKNESHRLAAFIEHHRGLSSDFIVVDTGSTDDTREVAKNSGARLEEFAWNSDFAAARNFSLKFAAMPWICCIDPDERIAERDFSTLLNLIAQSTRMAFSIVSRNYVRDPNLRGFTPVRGEYPEQENTLPGYVENTKLIIFKNSPLIRFEGMVHESVQKSVGTDFSPLPFPLHHTGMLPEVMAARGKQKLYLEIATKKAERFPEDARAHFELGIALLDQGDFRHAALSLERACDLQPQHPLILASLSTALRRSGDLSRALSIAQTAQKLAPDSLDAITNLALAAMALGNWPLATQNFELAFTQSPHSLALGRNLAECYKQLDNPYRAKDLLLRLTKIYPNDPALHEDLQRCPS